MQRIERAELAATMLFFEVTRHVGASVGTSAAREAQGEGFVKASVGQHPRSFVQSVLGMVGDNLFHAMGLLGWALLCSRVNEYVWSSG